MLRQIERLLWPLYCAGCGAYDVKLCASCKEELRGQITAERFVQEESALPVFVAGSYENVLRNVILKWKDHGRLDLGSYVRSISAALTCKYLQSLEHSRPLRFIVVPAPSSPRAVKARGRLQTEEIAKAVVRELRKQGHRAKVFELLKQKNIKKQVNFDAATRSQNKKNALRVRKIACFFATRYTKRHDSKPHDDMRSADKYDASGQAPVMDTLAAVKATIAVDTLAAAAERDAKKTRAKVILVDDISTTGTTLAVCQSTLEGSPGKAKWHFDCAFALASSKTSATA